MRHTETLTSAYPVLDDILDQALAAAELVETACHLCGLQLQADAAEPTPSHCGRCAVLITRKRAATRSFSPSQKGNTSVTQPNMTQASMAQPSIETLTVEAVRDMFGGDLAREIVESDAFGALVHHLTGRAAAYGQTPLQSLQAVDPDSRQAVERVDTPAAFLAARMRDLPAALPESVAGSVTASAPAEVVEVTDAVRTCNEILGKVGVQEFADAAGTLGVVELAWTLDRFADVCESFIEMAEKLAELVESHGVDASEWQELIGDLDSVTGGMALAMKTLDPHGQRDHIDNL